MKTFSDYGIEVPVHVIGKYQSTCPECSHTRKKSKEKCLSVNTDKEVWCCHHCGWSGGLKQRTKTPALLQFNKRQKDLGRAKTVTALAESDLARGVIHSTKDQKSIDEAKQKMDQKHNSDIGNAARLVKKHGHKLRYIAAIKKWLIWDKNRWCYDESNKIWLYAKDATLGILKEIKKESSDYFQKELMSHALKSQAEPRIRSMISLAKSELPIGLNELDTDKHLLGVTNGIINLKTGELMQPKPSDFITKQAPVKYDPAKDCLAWKAFLLDIMDGNQELIGFLQRAVGYSLSGDTSEQCLFFCYGTGANGKSTFLNAIKEILGDYAMQTAATTFMVKGDNAMSNDIAKLRGARLVMANELEEGQRFAESTIKQLTGQDTVSARPLYCESFEFIPQFAIWIAGNHMPIIRGDDLGIWRRIKLIPFAVTIPDENKDKDLPDMLRAEYPGILNWCLDGFKQWQAQGLNQPVKVTKATDEYKCDMDILQQWIDECCELDRSAITTSSKLYANHFEWAKEQYGNAMSHRMFGLKMKIKQFRKEKVQIVRYYGIKLRENNLVK